MKINDIKPFRTKIINSNTKYNFPIENCVVIVNNETVTITEEIYLDSRPQYDNTKGFGAKKFSENDIDGTTYFDDSSDSPVTYNDVSTPTNVNTYIIT